MPDKVLIPVASLQEGFEKCVIHIRSLIASSELLYSNKIYSGAFPFAVLAIEEGAKLGVIQEHIKDKRPIQRSEWQDLTRGGSHKVKLIMPLQKERTMLKSLSPEKFRHMEKMNRALGTHTLAYEMLRGENAQDYAVFMLLDTLKQDCFYIGWKNNDWRNFASNFTVDEQEAMVWLLTRQAKSWMLIRMMSNKYPNTPTESELTKIKADPSFVEFLELNKEFATMTRSHKHSLLRLAVAKYKQMQS
jgi:AbiV family abortive infection protein